MQITEPDADTFPFDIFLSHNSIDKPAVRNIATKLREQGVKCWFDEWNLIPGQRWVPELAKGLEESRVCAVFFGRSGVSPWLELEQELALVMGADARRGKRPFGIIPVRLPGAAAWQRLDLPPFLRLFTWIDLASLDDEAGLQRLIAGIRQKASSPSPIASSEAPYVGLRSLSERDSAFFFGRDRYVIDLIERIRKGRGPRFVTILGASGSGKSSLLNAGLIPQLRNGAIEGSQSWIYVTARPGNNAWANLRSAFRADSRLKQFVDLVPNREETWLHEVAAAALASERDSIRLILLLDQFEELFTARPSAGPLRRDYVERVWLPFLQNLRYATEDPAGRTHVLVNVRRDFFDSFANDPVLGPLLNDPAQRIILEPFNDMELRCAIEQPALACGVTLDDGLTESLVEDFRIQPAGSLPFLQQALSHIWRERDGDRMSIQTYSNMGRLRGSVNAHANSIFEGLSSADKTFARTLFLHLIRVSDDGGPDTKRRVPLNELPGGVPTQQLAQRLSQEPNRLLTLDQSEVLEVASPTVEIAHEALLAGWATLREWVAEGRPERLRLRRLEQAAHSWKYGESEAQDLMRGAKLSSAERTVTALPTEVTAITADYVRTSRSAVRRRIFLVTSACMLIFSVIIGVGFYQWRNAQNRRQISVIAQLNEMGGQITSIAGGWDVRFMFSNLDVNKALPLLPRLGSVRELDLSGTTVSDEALDVVRLLPMQRLNLSETEISDAGVARLANTPSLRDLDLSQTRVTGKSLTIVATLTNLVSLDLSATKINREDLMALGYNTRLEQLVLSEMEVDDDALTHLRSLTNLWRIELKSTQISAGGLEHLRGLSNLKVLNLSLTDIGDDAIERLSNLSGLKELWLKETRISDRSMKTIAASIPNLTILSIPVTKVTDVGMQSIGKLTELRQLYAGGCLGITTAGIAAITNLHRLELLAIPGNPVTDEAFSYLEQLPSLRELRIADTRISKNSRKAFSVKRPQIKILTN